MRELIAIYRTGDGREARIFRSTQKVRIEIYSIKPFVKLSYYDKQCFYVTEFLRLEGEKRMLGYVGITSFYKVPFEKKNGKLVLFPINKQMRIIWTNQNYDAWKEALIDDGEDEDDLTYERYDDDCSLFLDDERTNLNVDVDGYIVAFADLGLWNGRRTGAKLVGDNVRDILSSNDDYVTWFCDVYNVRCNSVHHDGQNHILYRVAKNKEHAKYLVNKIAYNDMTEEQFRKATKSLRPYIASIYGW